MVLEIKVPHEDGWEGLRALAPSLVIYVLSFTFTGIYWLNHQHIVRRTPAAGNQMQLANLFFLLCLSLLPLSTAYAVDKHFSSLGVAFYAFSLLVIASAFMLLRLAVHGHLKRETGLEGADRRGMWAHLFSMGVYAVSIALAFAYPRLALSVIGALTLFWAIPNMGQRTRL